jgi:cholesterol transport system auxiliary component
MKRLLMCVCLLLFVGCGPLVTRPPSPVLHDLGSAREPLSLKLALRDIEVRTPSWLEGTAMYYRLRYDSETRRDAYTGSRWSAAPAELLAVALRRMLDASVAGPVPTCRLRVEVDEFIQNFDRPDGARALVTGRASLIDARGQRVLARLPFSIDEPAKSADAAGGVAALARAVDALGGQIAAWLNSPELKDVRDGC